jgi:hypothetical protein
MRERCDFSGHARRQHKQVLSRRAMGHGTSQNWQNFHDIEADAPSAS